MEPPIEQIRAAREAIGPQRPRHIGDIQNWRTPSAASVRAGLIAAQEHDPVYQAVRKFYDAWHSWDERAVGRLLRFLDEELFNPPAAAPTEEEGQPDA